MPAPKPYVTNDDYIRELSGRIKTAIEKSDYSTLARLVVDAKGTSVAKMAANALVQMTSETNTRSPAEVEEADVGRPQDEPVVMDSSDVAGQVVANE
jgi:hypothetical protein